MRQFADHMVTGSPGRDAAGLAMRLMLARGMSIMTLFVTAWLVNIEAFAEFGVYQTLAALAWIALFLRYDAAIVSARTAEEAGEALRLCIGVGAVLLLVFTSLSLAAGGVGVMRMQLALLLPLSILGRGLLRLTFATATREGDFKGIGRASMVQSVLQPTILVLLVLSPLEDALCFVFADILGHASGVIYLGWRRRHHFQAATRDWSLVSLAAAAQRWKSLPLYNLPSSFLALAFVTSPLLIMPMTTGAVMAGHVALAYRIFDVPTQIITAASTPIFLNRLRPSLDRANPVFGRHIMFGLCVVLGLAYASMAGILMLADPLLSGTALDALSEVTPYVALFLLFVAIAAPLNDSCGLYPQQRRLVVIQALALGGSFLAAIFASWTSPVGALLTLAVISGLRALSLGELLRHLSNLSRQSFVESPDLKSASPAP
ncbi:hypothetical protein [Microvirga terricola]|uniref:Membrane protein involved in the export of O-antigen and teichoic acid n=1 Tax=Microvirga terricola TaxID=2719797 RepID=A0ABX0VCV1_9HYPH|nr:hypothetical protein [Microvirga terricola]NIX76790.1 hypothetical protein [Microvirga terricola]